MILQVEQRSGWTDKQWTALKDDAQHLSSQVSLLLCGEHLGRPPMMSEHRLVVRRIDSSEAAFHLERLGVNGAGYSRTVLSIEDHEFAALCTALAILAQHHGSGVDLTVSQPEMVNEALQLLRGSFPPARAAQLEPRIQTNQELSPPQLYLP